MLYGLAYLLKTVEFLSSILYFKLRCFPFSIVFNVVITVFTYHYNECYIIYLCYLHYYSYYCDFSFSVLFHLFCVTFHFLHCVCFFSLFYVCVVLFSLDYLCAILPHIIHSTTIKKLQNLLTKTRQCQTNIRDGS